METAVCFLKKTRVWIVDLIILLFIELKWISSLYQLYDLFN